METNTILISIIVVAGWIFCGILAYGFMFGHLQNSTPGVAKEWETRDKQVSFNLMLLGPIGLFLSVGWIFIFSGIGFQGIKTIRFK